jgi:hypothetical protein
LLERARDAGIPIVDEPVLEPALKRVTQIVLDGVEAAEPS